MENEMSFDEINEIFCNMTDADYELTKRAANEYYQYGSTALLGIASKRVNLVPEIILAWW